MMTLAPARPAARTDSGAGPARPADTGTGTRTSGFYRHDLDGLRGVAIALVAVFHVWFGRVSGGVDVYLLNGESKIYVPQGDLAEAVLDLENTDFTTSEEVEILVE